MQKLRDLRTRKVVGLNIGTSLDGADAVLIEVEGSGCEVQFHQIHFDVFSLPPALKKILIRPQDLGVRELAFLNRDLGQFLAECTASLVEAAGLSFSDLHLIGSHGVTLFHEPPRYPGEKGVSMQLGDPAILAEKTGATVVANFRAADLAAGGQGAPLMPYLDCLLFQDQPGTLLLNLGGIGNITYVSKGLENILAFDTGPANLPLNELTRRLTSGLEQFDRDGRLAASGTIDMNLLDSLESHRFFSMPPPKSTGREEFGEVWVQDLLRKNEHRNLVDILATTTFLVAKAVKRAYDDWIAPQPLRRVIVSGGGCHNKTLMHHLARSFEKIPVDSLEAHGFDPDAKEAILFALLANDRIFERPSSIPSATGALWPMSLGQIS